ncbi:MAG: NmrA family NAD(P)-binding protein [Polyangiaceae bacterium]
MSQPLNGSNTRPPRVLVVGATGQLGRKIALELVGARRSVVRVTYREGTNTGAVEALREAGAELVPADLTDPASLARACHQVDVVVSAVQGLREVIVDGQTRLLRAAEEAGVARMIPSDYALDFFKTDEGRNRNLDLRRELAGVLDPSPVRGTSLLCGAFMDLFAYGAMGPDRKTGVFRVWGDPDQPSDFTLTDDVARYVAAVALDRQAPRVVRVAGDTRSAREIAAIFEEVRGKPVKLQSAGTLEALDRTIERLRAEDPAEANRSRCGSGSSTRDMQSGRGRLSPLDNARYPSVQPVDLRTLLARAFAQR